MNEGFLIDNKAHVLRWRAWASVVTFILFSSIACERLSQPPESLVSSTSQESARLRISRIVTGEPSWSRQQWLDRVAKLLRGGKGIANSQTRDDLLAKSDAEIIDTLMAEREFADAVLDFNLFFLGFRKDQIRDDAGELSEAVFDFPSAIASAQAVGRQGDYLRLLDLVQEAHVGPLRPPVSARIEDLGVFGEELRARLRERIQTGLRKQIDRLIQNPATPPETACADFLAEFNEGAQFVDYGLQVSILGVGITSNIWYGKIWEICVGSGQPQGTDFVAELERVFAINERLFQSLKDFEPGAYSTQDLNNVKALDVVGIGFTDRWIQFGNIQRQTLLNSSTNFNRKRAAYVLSRFFCDDLTPINVEEAGDHAKGSHGAEASCMACHYKLDPMAGFFRDFGFLFGDYKNSRMIRFDDNATMIREEYQREWLAHATSPGGAKRKWNVGYIRSTTREELNDYGSTLDDLFAIIRTEPEVKRCLVKRVFEYFVSDQQALDAGYLKYLTDEFARITLSSNSTQAFKQTVKRVLLSESFRTQDPVADVCYDYPPGYDPTGKAPCRVAHLLEKNCVSCHDSTFDAPYLDLSTWEKMPDGGFGFPHLDQNGAQISRAVTFERLLARLTTTDPLKRMPLRKHMDALDREALFSWLNEILTSPNRRGFAEPQSPSLEERVCPAI